MARRRNAPASLAQPCIDRLELAHSPFDVYAGSQNAFVVEEDDMKRCSGSSTSFEDDMNPPRSVALQREARHSLAIQDPELGVCTPSSIGFSDEASLVAFLDSLVENDGIERVVENLTSLTVPSGTDKVREEKVGETHCSRWEIADETGCASCSFSEICDEAALPGFALGIDAEATRAPINSSNFIDRTRSVNRRPLLINGRNAGYNIYADLKQRRQAMKKHEASFAIPGESDDSEDEEDPIDAMLEESEWIHWQLLLRQAPSSFDAQQVHEALLSWVELDRGVLQRLLTLFMEKDVDAMGEVTADQMRSAAKIWLEQNLNSHGTALHLGGLVAELSTIDDCCRLSYYDYLNHMLCRRKSKVQLYQYDLSGGKVRWLSPVLFGKYLEGIWHTSIVVFGKEYWYGGYIFEGTANGQTPFGKPTKILDIGVTMRNRKELWRFIQRNLVQDFTPESYDIFSCNCNHFTDALSVFLLNERIPTSILQQPEEVMSSGLVRAARPILNHLLGNLGPSKSSPPQEDADRNPPTRKQEVEAPPPPPTSPPPPGYLNDRTEHPLWGTLAKGKKPFSQEEFL